MGLADRRFPGDKIGLAHAQDWNAILDAAQDARSARAGHDAGDGSEQGQEHTAGLVQNNSGQGLDRFAVLALGDPLILPSANLGEFEARPAFAGTIAAAADVASVPTKWCVLLEAVPAGGIGRAQFAGVCPVQVNMVNAGDPYADLAVGQTTLTSGSSGGARILWVEPGTGTKWAQVRLEVAASAPAAPSAGSFTGNLVGIATASGALAPLFPDAPFASDLYGIATTAGQLDPLASTFVVREDDDSPRYDAISDLAFHDPSYVLSQSAAGKCLVASAWGATSDIKPPAAAAAAGTSELHARADHVHAMGAVDWSVTNIVYNLGGLTYYGGQLVVNYYTLGGLYLDGGGALRVHTGCGIKLDGAGAVAVKNTDLAGDGLTTQGTCGLAVAFGCGLHIDTGLLAVKNTDLAGAGLVGGTGCALDIHAGNGLGFHLPDLALQVLTGNGIAIDPVLKTVIIAQGAGLLIDGAGKVAVNPGAGILLDGAGKVAINPGDGVKFDGANKATLDLGPGLKFDSSAPRKPILDAYTAAGLGLRKNAASDYLLEIDPTPSNGPTFTADLIDWTYAAGAIDIARTRTVYRIQITPAGLFIGLVAETVTVTTITIGAPSGPTVDILSAGLTGPATTTGTLGTIIVTDLGSAALTGPATTTGTLTATGSSGPTRTAKGTKATTAAGGSLTMTSVAVATGDMLIVGVTIDGAGASSLSGVTWNGIAMTLAAGSTGGLAGGGIYYLQVTTGATGSVVATMATGTNNIALWATSVSGLTNGTLAATGATNTGFSATPDSGTTSVVATGEKQYVACHVGWQGASGSGTWDSGYATDGQLVNSTAGSSDCTSGESYQLITSSVSSTAFHAKKTSAPSMSWKASCAIFH